MLLKHKFNDFECIIYGFILNFNTILIYLNLNTVKDVFFSKKKKEKKKRLRAIVIYFSAVT